MAGIGKVAVIGAGMAGLACARALADAGVDVTVIDKGRGLGGRIATRRGPSGAVDHGAVALSAKGGACAHAPYAGRFADYLEAAAAQGAAAVWPAAQGWVGLPGMSGIVRPLAAGLSVTTGVEVTSLAAGVAGWQLQGVGVPVTAFAQLVLAIPQPQALGLLSPWPALQQAVSPARMRAVWTAMARFDRVLPLRNDLLHRSQGPVERAIRDSAKPGRAGEAWVIHGSADWTEAHLERDKPEAAALLLAAFSESFGVAPMAPVWLEGHRWRYGLTAQALGRAFVRDANLGLSVCGDWCLGDTACDAFASGTALAEALLDQ